MTLPALLSNDRYRYVEVLERHVGAELVSVVVFGSQSRRERRSRRLAGDGRPRRDRAR